MATNPDVVDRKSLTFRVLDILSIFWHLLPVSTREGIEYIVIYCINMVLLFFFIYLVNAAIRYRKTSHSSMFSTNILSIFMSIVPFLLIPISVQYAGQIVSAYFSKEYKIELKTLFAVSFSLVIVIIYTLMMIYCYTITLSFRMMSFQTIEGGAQCKIYITSIIVTFFSSLTTYLSVKPSVAFMIVSIVCYIFNASSCFRCGTFVKQSDQSLTLGGSILGILMCSIGLYPICVDTTWGDYYFACFFACSIFIFIMSAVYIKGAL